jgi:hypothetical protein
VEAEVKLTQLVLDFVESSTRAGFVLVTTRRAGNRDAADGLIAMERVVAVETAPGHHEAWSLALLRREGRIQSNDLFLTWEAGQASALDSRAIPAGRDVGGVVVQRQIDGILVDVPYDVTFAFAFHAFRGGSPIHGAKPAAPPK